MRRPCSCPRYRRRVGGGRKIQLSRCGSDGDPPTTAKRLDRGRYHDGGGGGLPSNTMCTTGDDVTGTNGMCRARERGNIDSGTAAQRRPPPPRFSPRIPAAAVVSLSEPSANRRRTPESRRPVYARLVPVTLPHATLCHYLYTRTLANILSLSLSLTLFVSSPVPSFSLYLLLRRFSRIYHADFIDDAHARRKQHIRVCTKP